MDILVIFQYTLYFIICQNNQIPTLIKLKNVYVDTACIATINYHIMIHLFLVQVVYL